MKQLILLICLSITFFNTGISCSCGQFPTFYNNPQVRDFGKNCIAVLDSLSFDYSSDGLAAETGHFTLIDTLTNLKVDLGQPIIVYGQDGLNCGYSVLSLVLRDTYLLSLYDGFYNQIENDTFYLDGCGDFFLNLNDSENQGWTKAGLQDKISAIITNVTDAILIEPSIVVFPNPAIEKIFIQSEKLTILSINLFDEVGRLLQNLNALKTKNQAVIVSQYQAGTYLLQINTAKGSVYRKVVRR